MTHQHYTLEKMNSILFKFKSKSHQVRLLTCPYQFYIGSLSGPERCWAFGLIDREDNQFKIMILNDIYFEYLRELARTVADPKKYDILIDNDGIKALPIQPLSAKDQSIEDSISKETFEYFCLEQSKRSFAKFGLSYPYP